MIKKSQIKFILYFLVIFMVLFLLVYSAGLMPASLRSDKGDSLRTLWDKSQDKNINGENPVRIVIDRIGVDASISNPNTTDVSTLDDYLLQGAVRYPGAGFLGKGNMFIFGHSTGLVAVQNPAFKTFNGLKDLKNGDIIKVYGQSQIYRYRVSSVKLVNDKEALVNLGVNRDMLTLSTCNTFGAKSERYVIEADYIGIL